MKSTPKPKQRNQEEEEEDFAVRPSPKTSSKPQSGATNKSTSNEEAEQDDDEFDRGEEVDETDMVYDDDIDNNEGDEDDEPEVQLGVVTGKRFNFMTTPTSPRTTKLFGFPDLIDPSALASLPSCCDRPLVHLCQVSLPFEEWEERTIYVFGCWKCDDSYRAVRQQRRRSRSRGSRGARGVGEDASGSSSARLQTTVPTSTLGSWGGGDGEDDDVDLGELVKSTARRLEVSRGDEQSSSKELVEDDDDEGEKKKREDARTTIVLEMVPESAAPSRGGGAEFEHERRLLEKYNKTAKAMGEDTFDFVVPTRVRGEDHDYVSRLALNPKQRIRVCYGAKPLLPESVNKTGSIAPPPACENCGAQRKFEFQIVSTFIPDAEKALKRTFDWCTLLVYGCDESCQGGNLEEVCRLVWED